MIDNRSFHGSDLGEKNRVVLIPKLYGDRPAYGGLGLLDSIPITSTRGWVRSMTMGSFTTSSLLFSALSVAEARIPKWNGPSRPIVQTWIPERSCRPGKFGNGFQSPYTGGAPTGLP